MTDLDLNLEYQTLRAAAETGDLGASLSCAAYELAGRGVPGDPVSALARTRQTAAAGNSTARRILAVYSLLAEPASQVRKDALSMLARAADDGDTVAQRLLPWATAGRSGDRAMQDPHNEAPGPILLCERPFVGFYERFLSPLECRYVIAVSEDGMRLSKVLDSETGEQSHSDIRVSESRFWRPWAMDLVIHSIFMRILNAADIAPSLAEPMSVVRYIAGGKFKAHLDAFVNHTTGEIDDAVRTSTNIVYLNDGYGGGETAFLRPQIKVGGLTGDLLHFRNLTVEGDIDLEAMHAGMPVTHGEKWVIVQWGQRGPIDCPA